MDLPCHKVVTITTTHVPAAVVRRIILNISFLGLVCGQSASIHAIQAETLEGLLSLGNGNIDVLAEVSATHARAALVGILRDKFETSKLLHDLGNRVGLEGSAERPASDCTESILVIECSVSAADTVNLMKFLQR